jgi:hypothetical protein
MVAVTELVVVRIMELHRKLLGVKRLLVSRLVAVKAQRNLLLGAVMRPRGDRL